MTLESDLIIPGARVYNWHYKVHLAKYVFAAQFVNGKEVLDIGCGVGYGSSYLLSKGARSITGGDNSEEAIELAQANFQRPGLNFVNIDACRLPFEENSFDLVTSIGMIDHVDDPEKLISESNRVLRYGGRFLCGVMNKQFMTLPLFNKSLDVMHKIEFTPVELSQLVGKYFSDIELYGSTASKVWYRMYGPSRYIFNKLFTERGTVHNIVTTLIRVVFPNKYRPLIYSENRVDKDFASGSGYIPITSDNQSKVDAFAVIGLKLRL